MLKQKINNEYVPANCITVVREACPVPATLNGAIMKVINGVWSFSVLPRLVVEEPKLIFTGLVTTVSGTSFQLPTELNMIVSNHTLREA